MSGRSTYCCNIGCHPFTIPKIREDYMIRQMEGFTFALALDLNMGYYHIKLDADAQNLYKIVFPWEKLQMETLIHGYQDCLVLDYFQNFMSKLIQNM
jgi:hypothetical protein